MEPKNRMPILHRWLRRLVAAHDQCRTGFVTSFGNRRSITGQNTSWHLLIPSRHQNNDFINSELVKSNPIAVIPLAAVLFQ
jgi:hypothetical protein